MEIKSFEEHGRKILVEFTCYRCKKTATRPLEDCRPKEYSVRGLYDLIPPKGWEDGGFYYPLFCPDCREDYKAFMDGAAIVKNGDNNDCTRSN